MARISLAATDCLGVARCVRESPPPPQKALRFLSVLIVVGLVLGSVAPVAGAKPALPAELESNLRPQVEQATGADVLPLLDVDIRAEALITADGNEFVPEVMPSIRGIQTDLFTGSTPGVG